MAGNLVLDNIGQGKHCLGVQELDKVQYLGIQIQAGWFAYERSAPDWALCYLRELASLGRGSLFLCLYSPQNVKTFKMQKIKNMINTHTLLSALHMADPFSFFRLNLSVTSTKGGPSRNTLFQQVSAGFTDPVHFLFITQHTVLFYF